MNRGIVLSIDLLAAIVITILALSLVLFQAGTLTSSSHKIFSSLEASDALIILHKTGVLAGENSTLIANELEKLVTEYYLTVSYYDLDLNNYLNISAGQVLGDYSFSKRPFYWYGNKTILGVAELRVR